MNRFHTINTIEQQFERADRRRRTARYLRHLGLLFAVSAAALIVLAALLASGVVASTPAAVTLHVIWAVISLLALGFMTLFDWARPARRAELAAAIERSHHSLHDRLNTLADIKASLGQSPFVDAISEQAAEVLKSTPAPPAFSFRRAWTGIATGIAMALVVILFYRWFQPWQRMKAAELAAAERSRQQALVLPEQDPASAAQADESWGEVRISEPGHDIRAADFDVIPLQIEAATSDPLQRVNWFAAVNGQEYLSFALPKPDDPQYAVFRDELLLTELRVRDWDVVSYYAQATTSDGKDYRSDLYFVDILPLREQLERTPGGTQGAAYRLLQYATALVQRQQAVVRQQFRAEQLPPDQAHQRSQMRESLALEEKDLAQEVRRVAAQAQAEWPGEERVEQWTEKLEQSAVAIEQAESALRRAAEGERPREPQQALQQLIAARRALDEMLQANPEAFNRPPDIVQAQPSQQEIPAEQLAAAQQQAQELAQQQQQLAERAADTAARELAPAQQQLAQKFGNLDQQFPQATQPIRDQLPLAEQAGHELATQLQQQPAGDKPTPQTAEHMQQLARMMQLLHNMMAQLGLQQDLQRSMQQLQDIEKNPDQYSQQQMQQQAQQTRELLDRAEQQAQKDPARSQQLSQTLQPPNRDQLQSACEKLGNCRNASEKSQAAAGARSALGQVASAMSADQAQQAADQLHADINRQMPSLSQQQQALQAARDDVKKMLGDQRRLQRDANPSRSGQQSIGQRQEQLLESFQQAMLNHTDAFDGLQQQVGQTQDAMHNAAQTFRNSPQQGRAAAEQAGDQLQNLDTALEEKQQIQQLVERFQLSQLMQRQMQQLQQMSQAPQNFSQQTYPQTAGDSRSMCDRGMQAGASSSSQAASGSPSTPSPSAQQQQQRRQQQQQQVHQAAEKLAQAADDAAKRQAAEQLRQAMRPLAEQLRPEMPAGLQLGNDNMRETGHQALARGMRQLDSLASRSQGQRRLTDQQQQQLRNDAAENFAEGIPAVYGHNQRSSDAVQRIRKDLTEEKELIDLQKVRELLSQVQQLQREVASGDEQRTNDAELTSVDPSQFPPAYRRAIERYFQSLSEQK